MARTKTVSSYGKNLKRILREKNITQSTLSDLTGIEQGLISNYATGKSCPSFHTADIIASALGCSLDEFRD